MCKARFNRIYCQYCFLYPKEVATSNYSLRCLGVSHSSLGTFGRSLVDGLSSILASIYNKNSSFKTKLFDVISFSKKRDFCFLSRSLGKRSNLTDVLGGKKPSTRSDATNPTLLRLCAGYDRMTTNVWILRMTPRKLT